jgi:hypothetical protein
MKTRMGDHVERASRWIYHGIWGVLVRWFKVPDRPPELPCRPERRSTPFSRRRASCDISGSGSGSGWS